MQEMLAYFTTEGSLRLCMLALLGAVGLDYITGLIKAIYAHTLKSSTAKEGLIRKFAVFAVVGACALLDFVLPVETGYGISKLAAISFVISEVVSILENAAAVGVPIPENITKRLAQIKDADTEKKEDKQHENCN